MRDKILLDNLAAGAEHHIAEYRKRSNEKTLDGIAAKENALTRAHELISRIIEEEKKEL